MYILPRHIWEAEDPITFTNDEMIGSGPFVLAEYSQDEFVRLTANDELLGRGSHRRRGDLPNLQQS